MFNYLSLKKYLKLSLLYVYRNKLTSLFLGYIFISILLKAMSGIDVTIPCPINKIWGIHCFGCGLTTATILILKFEFTAAWHANPFAYLIDPLLIFFFVRHWYSFIKEESLKNTLHDSSLQ